MKQITVTALTPLGKAGILQQLQAQDNAPAEEKEKLNKFYEIITSTDPFSVTMRVKTFVTQILLGKGEGMRGEIIKGMGEAVIDKDYTVVVE